MSIHNRKADYRFDTNSSYLACIENIRTIEHPRVEGAIVSVKLTLSIEGKLVGGELKVPEGRLACECVDFSPSYEPINHLGRQILSKSSGPAFSSFEHLQRLKGMRGECIFGPPSTFTDFQPILSWSAAQNGLWSHLYSGTPLPRFVFRPYSNEYLLRFSMEDFDELDTFRTCPGLDYYYQILMAAGERISSLELIRRRTGLGCPKVQVCDMGVQDILDDDGVRDLLKEKSELQQEIEQARSTDNITMQQLFEKELETIQSHLDKLIYRIGTGKTKKVKFPDPKDKARKAIDTAIRTARNKIRRTMPNLAAFLQRYVKGEDYGFKYRLPNPAPDWHFS